MSTISIKIKETNPFKLQKKTKLVQELSDLDNEVLEKLVELKKSKKPLQWLPTRKAGKPSKSS